MKLLFEKNENTLNEMIFENFIYYLNNLKDKNQINIWVSWWKSVLKFYNYISENSHLIENNIWNKINFWFVDERVVPFEDKDSNYWMLYKEFFQKIIHKNIIKENQIIKIYLNSKNICKDYTKKLPYFDIGFFWVWEDWHIASLFPWHKLLKDKTNSFLLINDSPKLPKTRITVSPLYIHCITTCFVFFMWKEKIKAFENFLDPGIWENKCPAKITYNCENLLIISDN